MRDFQEIPQQFNDLFEMSKDYLIQETVEPAKKLGKQAGMGVGGAVLFSLGAFLAVLGLYSLLVMVLPESEWYVVLARFLTAVAAAGSAAIVGWRLNSDYL